jgi:hypothetical protein
MGDKMIWPNMPQLTTLLTAGRQLPICENQALPQCDVLPQRSHRNKILERFYAKPRNLWPFVASFMPTPD